MEQSYYTKAPITEAVIDIRTTLDEGYIADNFLSFQDVLKPDYSHQGDVIVEEADFGTQDNPIEPAASRTRIGYQFASSDRRTVVMVSTYGFTVSKLAPYGGWTEFRHEAVRLWSLYKAFCHPQLITRIGIRYINQLDMPKGEKISDYLAAPPRLPTGFPHNKVAGIFCQFKIAQPDLAAMLVFNQAIAPPPNPDTASYILDFDLFREAELAPEAEVELWALLDAFRERKNELFEACITDRTRKLIR